MANFLVTTANTLQEGTSTADLFYFNTARGVSVRGLDGNDTITAGTASMTAVNMLLAGNGGNDTINLLSALHVNQGSIYGGAGTDFISATNFSAVDTTIQGGGGNDTLDFNSAVFTRGNIGLNAGDDVFTAGVSAININSSLVALGGGADIFSAISASAVGATINGGGGADQIDIDGNGLVRGGQINGDVLGDNTFFGNDTIEINVNEIYSATTINGGFGNDTISAVANNIGTSFINGNDGADVIVVDGISTGAVGGAAASSFIGGGAGNDTITVSVVSGNVGGLWGTLNGGGGNDTIIYSALTDTNELATAGATGGYIQGGAGADSISFNGGGSGAVATLLYTAASDSNIDSFDTVSSEAGSLQVSGAALTLQTYNVFAVNTPESRESAAGEIGGNEVYTGVEGIVTFTSTFSDNLADQVSALDVNTNDGTVALFSKTGSTNTYLFMQGGSAGTADDLLVKVNTQASQSGATKPARTTLDVITVQGNTAITLGMAAN